MSKQKKVEDTAKVENVHEEVDTELQEKLDAKAKGLVEYMNEEPKARLIPNLRVNQDGIIPDVRLVLVQTEDDINTGTETEGEGDGGEGPEEAGTTESVSPQDS